MPRSTGKAVAPMDATKKKPRFVLKIGEIFKTKADGFRAITNALKKSRKVRLSNLSTELFQRFYPKIERHQTKEIFLHDSAQEEHLPDIGAEIEPVNSRWFQDFFGQRVNMGEVLTPTSMFHILWTEDNVHRIFANTDPKCIECAWKKNYMKRLEGEQLYASVYDRDAGVQYIVEKAQKAEIFRACIIPPFLLRQIIPFAFKGDYRFILSRRDPILKHFKKNFDVRMGSEAKIFFVYGGEEANVGSLQLNNEMFSIFWRGDKIFSILRFERLICSNCIVRVFDTAWKYSRAITQD